MAQPLPAAHPPLDRRNARLQQLQSEVFDCLVIGGGITGAAIARDAALRGLRVALVERHDFASGTSSKSARIVHGGLRYIASAQLAVVREASAERHHLRRTTPELVRDLPHTCPIYDKRLRVLGIWLGMQLYELLALTQNIGHNRLVSRAELARLEPALSQSGLLATLRYCEASADDARLTLATALAAERHGALPLNYVSVEALLKTQAGRIAGAVVREALTGAALEVRAAWVVNATGPWSPALQQLDDVQTEAPMHPSKGIHLVVPRERLPINDAVVFRAAHGGTYMYALPWNHTTIIGTTDNEYGGELDSLAASGDEVRQVLDSTRRTFPQAALTDADVLSTYAGVRPLVAQAGVGVHSTSREHRVSISASGLISITGGKLTTHRRMARDVVDVVVQRLAQSGRRPARPDLRPDRLPLEDPAETLPDVELTVGGLAPDVQSHLRFAYGKRWPEVAALAQADPRLGQRIRPPLPYLHAEVTYAVQHELALTLTDVMARRMHFIHEDRSQGLDCAPGIAAAMARQLGWSEPETAHQLEAYAQEVARTRRWRGE